MGATSSKPREDKDKYVEMNRPLDGKNGVTFHDKKRVWDYIFMFVNSELDPDSLETEKERKAAKKFLKKNGITSIGDDDRQRMNEDRQAVINRLLAVGFDVSPKIIAGNKHFQMYRVSCPLHVLTKWAEHIGLEKELTERAIDVRVQLRLEELEAGNDDDDLVPSVKRSHIPRFEEYTFPKAQAGDFIQDKEGEFSSGERQRIMFNIFTAQVTLNNQGAPSKYCGCGLDPISGRLTHKWGILGKVEDPKLLHKFEKYNGFVKNKKDAVSGKRAVITETFPLHEDNLRSFLMKRWVMGPFSAAPWHKDKDGLLPWEQPFDEIRNYLGEKIALYFAWLGFYTTWLFPISAIGLLVFIIQMATSADSPATVVYCFLLTLWATAFQEFWKRRQSTLAWEWNVMDFEEEEPVRPTFNGVPRASPITGEIELYYPRTKRWMHYGVSLPSLLTMVIIIFMTTLALVLFKVKAKLPPSSGGILGPMYHLGGAVGGISQGFLIIILNTIFKKIAEKLNEAENHRTQTDYEDALIAKIFAFQFVNSYFSLFYIAFLKNNVPLLDGSMDECKPSCMTQLTTQLSSVFIVQVVVGQIKEALIPTIKGLVKKAKVRAGGGEPVLDEKGQILLQAGLPMYDTNKDVMADYNEMVIQFGYVTMFAAAFPLASVVALLNNILEIRSDAAKILKLFKRPHYKGAEDIGTWAGILDLLSWIAIITNSAILGFTSDILDSFGLESLGGRLAAIILFEHLLIILKAMMAAFIPDMPKRIRDELAREDYAEKEAMKRIEAVEAADYYEERAFDDSRYD